MTAPRQPDSITVSDYLAGEEISDTKHEYLGGTVHAMAGATIRHNNIALNCLASLHGKLRGKSCQPFNSDTKIRIEFPDHTRFFLLPGCDGRLPIESGFPAFPDPARRHHRGPQ
jgi:Uma2 family endonuclease